MTYEKAIEWLFEQFPSYQNIGEKAYKPGLNTIKNLLEEFDNPQKDLKFIHVAGTNGKGSTSSMIASVLTESKNNVGLFTSPHIEDFRERIRINGKKINRKFVIQIVTDVQERIATKKKQLNPSFFEITFLIALLYFHKKKCNICVIETGLGGRLDATNCINPILTVITNISLEHTNFLGNTIEEIAIEKAGIIKKNVPVVIGEKHSQTKDIFKNIASKNDAPIAFATKKTILPDSFSLPVSYQYKNARTAILALKILNQHFLIKSKHIKRGLKHANIYKNTGLFARTQLIESKPYVWIDVAHNAQGIKESLKQVKDKEELHIIYGTSADKNLHDIFKYFPKQARYFFTEFSNKRSISLESLKNTAKEYKLNANFYSNVNQAVYESKSCISKDGTIIILGSFFLIADYMHYNRKNKKLF